MRCDLQTVCWKRHFELMSLGKLGSLGLNVPIGTLSATTKVAWSDRGESP